MAEIQSRTDPLGIRKYLVLRADRSFVPMISFWVILRLDRLLHYGMKAVILVRAMHSRLRSLIVRQKWHVESRNVQAGDIVLVEDLNALRGDWKIA